jgi:hypothetical protein
MPGGSAEKSKQTWDQRTRLLASRLHVQVRSQLLAIKIDAGEKFPSFPFWIRMDLGMTRQ